MSVWCGISHGWCTLKYLGEFYACAKFEEEPKEEIITRFIKSNLFC